MTRQTIYILYLLALGVASFGCGDQPVPESGTEEGAEIATDVIALRAVQFERGNMQLGQMEERTFSEFVRASGVLEVPVKHHMQVSAYAGGYVKRINLIPGQRIRKGQTLFTLENPTFVQMQQDLLEAQAQLVYLKSDYERQKSLAADSVASQKSYFRAESAYRATLARMEGLKKQLSLLGVSTDELTVSNMVTQIAVRAPSTGYVTEVRAMQGMFLSPTDVALEMVNTDHLHLELAVFEKDILQVKEGQAIRFRIPEASPDYFAAEVYLIGKSVDETSRAVRVHGHLNDEQSLAFVPGMFVEAEILTESQLAQGLPESAVVETDGKQYVWVRTGKGELEYAFEKRDVQTGMREDGFIQIVNAEDFSASTPILVSGAFVIDE